MTKTFDCGHSPIYIYKCAGGWMYTHTDIYLLLYIFILQSPSVCAFGCEHCVMFEPFKTHHYWKCK